MQTMDAACSKEGKGKEHMQVKGPMPQVRVRAMNAACSKGGKGGRYHMAWSFIFINHVSPSLSPLLLPMP